MADYLFLIQVALVLGGAGLGVFLWSMRSGQYDEDVPLQGDRRDEESRTDRRSGS